MTGTALYQRTMAEDYGDENLRALQAEVWTPTPWMIYVRDGGREHEIRNWLNHHFSREGSPIHDQEGDWHKAYCTIHGWTWYGFKTEAMMQEFQAAWPSQVKE